MGKCQCPIWCYGRIDGRMVRLSCGTRSQDRAAVVMNRLLHPAKADAPTGEIADRANEGDDVSTARAVKTFLESRRMRDTKEQSLAIYERVLTDFANYCESYSVVALKGITSEHIVGFMQAHTWKSATKGDRLVLLRSFFRFAMAMEWIVRDPAIKERCCRPAVVRRWRWPACTGTMKTSLRSIRSRRSSGSRPAHSSTCCSIAVSASLTPRS